MSIYIQGVSVSCCLDCPCASYSPTGEYDGFWKCDAKRKIIKGSLYEKQEWCSLIEIQPHGRLVDADALELDADWEEQVDGYTGYSRLVIDAAPTIIPADKDGDAK